MSTPDREATCGWDCVLDFPHDGPCSALKPCPFCGASAEIIEVEEADNKGGFVVSCTGCEASTKVWFPIKDDVRHILRDEWNRRVRPRG